MARVQITVDADGTTAVKTLKDVGEQGEKAFKGLGASAVAMGTLMADAVKVGIGLVKQGLEGLVSAGKEWSKAAAEQETADLQLAAALKATGQFTHAYEESLHGLATKYAELTGSGDELIEKGFVKLITVGKVLPEQMDKTALAAANLAAYMGTDLDSAMQMLARGAAGVGRQLKQQGIEIQDTGDKHKDFAHILDEINTKMAGQAVAASESYAGTLKRLDGQVEELKETMGTMLNQSLAPMVKAMLSEGIPAIKQFIEAHKTEIIRGFADVLILLVETTMVLVSGTGTLIEAYTKLRSMLADFAAEHVPKVVKGYQALAELAAEAARNTGHEGLAGKLDEAAQGMGDFSDGVIKNAEDQKKLHAETTKSVEAVLSLAAGIKLKLVSSLEDVKKGADLVGPPITAMIEKAVAGKEALGDLAAGMVEGYDKLKVSIKSLPAAYDELIKSGVSFKAAAAMVGPAIAAAAKQAKEFGETLPSDFLRVQSATKNTGTVVNDVMAYMTERIKSAGYAGATMAGQIDDGCKKALASMETVGQKMDKVMQAAIDSLNRFAQAKASIDIGTDNTVDVDKSSDVFKSIMATAKHLGESKNSLVAQFAKQFSTSLAAGDLGALQNILVALADQTRAVEKIPGEGNARVAGELRNMQVALEGLVSQFKSIATARPAAGGGLFNSGEYGLVGEQGPELVRFGGRAQVYTNTDTNALAAAWENSGHSGKGMTADQMANAFEKAFKHWEWSGDQVKGQNDKGQTIVIQVDGKDLARIVRFHSDRGQVTAH